MNESFLALGLIDKCFLYYIKSICESKQPKKEVCL